MNVVKIAGVTVDLDRIDSIPRISGGADAPAVKVPAQRLTRTYWKKVPGSGAAFTIGGANVSFDLLQEGWCPGLLLRISGTITVATATLVDLPRGPFNIFSKALVQPPGAQPIVNCGGHALHVANQVGKDFTPDEKGYEDTAVGLDVNAGANDPINTFVHTVGAGGVVSLWYWIPFARSAYDWTGSLGLGNRSKTQLVLTPETLANLFTTPANLTVQALVANVYQAIIAPFPRDASVVPWDTTKVYTLEEQSQALVIGDNYVNIDPKNRIQRVWHEVWNTNARAEGEVTNIDVAFDGSYFLNNFDAVPWFRIAKARQGGRAPFPGTIMFDYDYLLDADGAASKLLGGAFEVSKGSWFNTERVAAVRHRIVKDATALANTPRIWTIIQREATLVG